MQGVHFFNNDHGIVLGDPVDNSFEIYTTADAAVTWTRTPATNIPQPLQNEYINTNHFDTTAGIFRFMTNKYRLFSSYDQGLTWVVSQTPDNSIYNYGDFFQARYFSFKNANEGLLITAGYDAPTLHRTTDGGTTWAPVSTTGIIYDRNITYIPQTSSTYYTAGRFNDHGFWSNWNSSYSTNNGDSWTNMTENQNFKPMTTEFFSPTVGYAVGYAVGYDDENSSGRGFYRLTDTFNRLLKNKSFLETNFSVSPNPTKDIFKINGLAIESVTIHDASGKAIHDQSFARTDQAEINLSGLSTGIYFANVSNDNGSKTIKIIKN